MNHRRAGLVLWRTRDKGGPLWGRSRSLENRGQGPVLPGAEAGQSTDSKQGHLPRGRTWTSSWPSWGWPCRWSRVFTFLSSWVRGSLLLSALPLFSLYPPTGCCGANLLPFLPVHVVMVWAGKWTFNHTFQTWTQWRKLCLTQDLEPETGWSLRLVFFRKWKNEYRVSVRLLFQHKDGTYGYQVAKGVEGVNYC